MKSVLLLLLLAVSASTALPPATVPAAAGNKVDNLRQTSDGGKSSAGHVSINRGPPPPRVTPGTNGVGNREQTVEELQAYMDYYLDEYQSKVVEQANAEWNFQTNITTENSNAQIAASLALSSWLRSEWKENISQFNTSILDQSENNAELKRLFEGIQVLGMPALEDVDLTQWSQIISNMTTIYGSAKICPFDKQDCDPAVDPTWALEPDLEDIFLTRFNQSDYELLQYIWEKWRDVSGRQVRDMFITYVELTNKGAQANDLPDGGALWLQPYENENFKNIVSDLYEELRPFYEKLHAFVRHRLMLNYGEDKIDPLGPIPAHLLGNMWAQGWQAIFPIVSEFDAPSLDVTAAMKEQGYTVRKMFETSDAFFTGLGLEGLETAAIDFYNSSMLEKPSDGRDVVCHASAWDFLATDDLPGDFRIKMCTGIDMDDLITIHHEMGHIQYYMQYVKQPPLFREGANPGFHEAIGDTLALSVATPKHLKSIGLLNDTFELDDKAQLAFLLKMALEKVAFLPFGYIMDLYRWRIFDGNITTDKLNEEWWNLRQEFQGIKPPVPRTERDFDPGAKYHVVSDVPYIRYFVAHVLQFMFHQTLCEAAGEYDLTNPDSAPLHECDIGGSAAAGEKLKKVLQAGSSRRWEEILMEMMGSTKSATDVQLDASSAFPPRYMTVEPLINYFRPLEKYLDEYIEANELCVGWLPEGVSLDQHAQQFLDDYNAELEQMLNAYLEADWNAATNITEENTNNALEASASFSNWEKAKWKEAQGICWRKLPEGEAKRQFEMISVLGTSALYEAGDRERTKIIQEMTTVYSTAKICPPNDKNCENPSLSLDPDLESMLASTSAKYDDLAHIWKAWRDATGKKVKKNFERYVTLSNEAAVSNLHPNITNYADLWLRPYELANFTEEVDRLWNETKGFYLNLHAYVRYQLRKHYKDNTKEIKEGGPIPAHILGNMWSQDWSALYPIVSEFKDVPELDVTDQLVQDGYDVRKMFNTSDEFFGSLGLTRLAQGAPNFWDLSMLEKPNDRDVVCHASAWDMYKSGDFRIKMCTDITSDDFIVIHHEMGHTQYQMQYSTQPAIFRDGANPGFHEAIGDVMALSVSTPQHLATIGLLSNATVTQFDEEDGLAFLLRTALSKIAFLPFAYIMDKFRWEVFRGDVKPEDWNHRWWELREEYQGIKPPVLRSESDFDHAAKFHSVADVSYIQYFVSYIIQFSFHEALCIAAGQFIPGDPNSKLHECDISQGNPTAAGEKLKTLMQSGSSKPWPEVMEAITGSRQLSAKALLDYFAPLNTYLEGRLEELKATPGWSSELNDYFKEDSKGKEANQTVPIVVGAVIGGIAVVLLVVFMLGRRRRRNKQIEVS